MTDADGLALAAELLAAIADVHTPRGLVRGVAEVLASRVPLHRVELHAQATPVAVECVDEQWRGADPEPHPRAVAIASGWAVVPVQSLPVALTRGELHVVVERILTAATRHVAVVQRVADLSQHAHVESRELRTSLARLERRTEIVARSAAMRAVVERARRVAAYPTTVLLTGASGTGKEIVAREIHQWSPRAHRAMQHLNCAALPDSLIESELFGHERGAFTGAERALAGVFERTDRGTLLLDEVGELPLGAQAKLLRVLEERKVRRVGGTALIDVDVRLIAATNRDLAAMVRTGAFREDLYYRLAVFAIEVPMLCDRRADLAPLVRALVGELAGMHGLEPPQVTRAVLARLEAYEWPGNVRELRNVLETALILGGGRSLELPERLVPRAPREPGFAQAMRGTIEAALRTTRGKIYGTDGAAARLGLKPGTLQSKMKKLGIRRADFRAA